jgi:hypothetical protein
MGCFHEWWPALWSPEIFQRFKIENRPCGTGTGTGRKIAAFMHREKLTAIRTKRSMGIHLGEAISTLNSESRGEFNLVAIEPELFDCTTYRR